MAGRLAPWYNRAAKTARERARASARAFEPRKPTQEDRTIGDTILYAVDEGVATLTLNRPDKLNAFTDEMLGALGRALAEAARDDAVRCVVITGSGRGFCAGQDLDAVRARDPESSPSFRKHLDRTYNRVIRQIRSIEKPVVAAVNGVAAGAGASVALACDLRVAAEGASFIQSFVGVGLVPDSGATWFLPRMVGYARAFELAATAERLGASDAADLGIVNHVVPDDELAGFVTAYARKLADGPTKAIGLTKRAMNRSLGSTLDAALDYEARLQEIAGRTSDHHEGVSAFIEKRQARFEGR